MNTFLKKLIESFFSVFPVVIIVLGIHFFLVSLRIWDLYLYLAGSLFVIIGMAIFTLGADLAMMPMGEYIGSRLTKTKKLIFLIPITFFLGAIITIAEPDLQILAKQVPSFPSEVLILTISGGVGLFLVIALLRILFHLSLSVLLIGLYLGIFLLAAFTQPEYLAVAFDSGGVTTGPITVPFILALGAGLSAVLGGRSSHDDSFGLVGLCSVGPILAVLLLGTFYDAGSASPAAGPPILVTTFTDLLYAYQVSFLHTLKEVAIALLPIIFLFAIFQLSVLHLSKQRLLKLLVGMFFTYIGLVFFLTGVKAGFLPMGSALGEQLGRLGHNWILIPLAAIIGFFVVAAEPAVHVLNTQVQDITGGAISKRVMMASLSIGVGGALALSMARILFDFSIWFLLLPGYILALGFSLFVPKIFTAIAFDSGGVASGPMTATFLLPLGMGVTHAVGGDMVRDAFGIVSLVAMTPLITIQIMGLVYRIKLSMTDKAEQEALLQSEGDEEMIEWEDNGQEETGGVE